MYLCTCERVAEKGDFGSCFRGPFHRTQPAALTFFRPQAPRVLKLCPKMDLSRSTLWVMAGGIYHSLSAQHQSSAGYSEHSTATFVRAESGIQQPAGPASVRFAQTACPSSSLAFYLRRYILVTVAITIAIGAAARLTRNAVRYLGLE